MLLAWRDIPASKGDRSLGNTNNNESVSYARSPVLPGVELMTARSSSHHWRVFHEQYALCSNDVVAAEIRYRKNLHRIVDRSISLFEPGETHETHRVAKPQDFQVLFLMPDTMQKYSEEMDIPGQPHFKPIPDINEQLYSSCKHLHTAIINDAPAIEQQSRLAECVGMLLSNHAEKRVPNMLDSGKQALFRARDYLHDQYAQSVSLDEIAAISGLSRFHFLKVFSAQFGLPPHIYQICLRIERSLPLLRQGISAPQIAETLGFYDQSHFIRNFKRTMGVTPGNYQGKVSGDPPPPEQCIAPHLPSLPMPN
jgi:AraC-like DNA-binding protein